ncbi:MAG TPA: urease accessory UreF family protein [Tepidisphaeraceae bacterium]|nr:urease accessory UreF family protein [Tepidisphaeraceae bacterium]
MKGDWLVWQMVDSAFPTGGFAHSAGLESAWQQGEVRSPEELRDFIGYALVQQAAGALPFALEARRRPEAFADLDALLDAMLTNHVANRASRAQGRALAATAVDGFGMRDLYSLRPMLRAGRSPGHLAPVYGMVAAIERIPLADTGHMLMFTHLRGLISAAVRLGIIGPLQGQRLQRELSTLGGDLAERAADRTAEDAAQTSPMLDLLQASHERLYSKLFVS